MIIDGINIPNELINDLKNDKLVVFAGAGISMGKPTRLPNFVDLANQIALGTGKKADKDMACEVFLGDLKAQGVPVNRLAADILSKKCLKPNQFHKSLINLFEISDHIRIVTTNYDKMLEKALSKNIKDVRIFNSPALPLGDDFRGIIHIHGNVDNPDYMVLTDEDFGKAYLTEGYVSRFLVKLFENYTILFVGYSYNDVIMRYFTKAMTRLKHSKRYILTCEDNPVFNSLGIEPIIFPTNDYDTELDVIVKLGDQIKRGLSDWNTIYGELNDNVPVADDEDSEIIYSLEDENKCRLLLANVHNPLYISYFDKKKLFDCCFEEINYNRASVQLWGNWLCENFITNSEQLLELIALHKNTINSEFAAIIIRSLVDNFDDLSEEQIGIYYTIVKKQLNNVWLLHNLINKCIEKRYKMISYVLFKHFFRYEIAIETRNWGIGKTTELRHFNKSNYYAIKAIWDEYSEILLELFPKKLLFFSIDMIEKIHDDYVICGETKTESDDPFCINMISIEPENKDLKYTTEDTIYILCEIAEKSYLMLQEQYYSKSVLHLMIESNSTVLRKLALKLIRESVIFSDDEKIELLINNYPLNDLSCKEQIFLLIKHVYGNASDLNRNQLIDSIIKSSGDDGLNPDIKEYYLFNWTVWLLSIDDTNRRIKELQKDILNKNPNFKPRKHPELDIEFSSGGWNSSSPIATDNMARMGRDGLLHFLLTYKEDGFEGPSRDGLLKAFSECVSRSFEWAIEFANTMVNQEVKEIDIWNHFFFGLNDSDISSQDYINGIEFLRKNYILIPDDLGMAKFLLNSLQSEDMVNYYDKNRKNIFEFSKKLINLKQDDNDYTDFRVIDLTLNTTFGIVLTCWIIMSMNYEKESLRQEFIDCFESALNTSGWKKNVAICLLAGRYNYFAYRDLEWSDSMLKTYFLSNDRDFFSAAWEGVAYFSSRFNPDFIDDFIPVYLNAAGKITLLDRDVRFSFINRLLTVLIFVVKNPCEDFIPSLYNNNDIEIIRNFINDIGNLFQRFDKSVRDSWWNGWLRDFIMNRIQNKPKPMNDDEFSMLLSLIIDLTDVFDEVCSIVCDGMYVPHKIDGQVWYELASNIELIRNYKSAAYKLICFLLNTESDTYIYTHSIVTCVNSLDNLSIDEKNTIRELLLKRDISLSDVTIL